MEEDWRKRLAVQDERLESLRRELQTARAEYDLADDEFKRLTRLGYEIGPESVDGAHALHIAASQFKNATQEYSEALSKYTKYLLSSLNARRK